MEGKRSSAFAKVIVEWRNVDHCADKKLISMIFRRAVAGPQAREPDRTRAQAQGWPTPDNLQRFCHREIHYLALIILAVAAARGSPGGIRSTRCRTVARKILCKALKMLNPRPGGRICRRPRVRFAGRLRSGCSRAIAVLGGTQAVTPPQAPDRDRRSDPRGPRCRRRAARVAA